MVQVQHYILFDSLTHACKMMIRRRRRRGRRGRTMGKEVVRERINVPLGNLLCLLSLSCKIESSAE